MNISSNEMKTMATAIMSVAEHAERYHVVIERDPIDEVRTIRISVTYPNGLRESIECPIE